MPSIKEDLGVLLNGAIRIIGFFCVIITFVSIGLFLWSAIYLFRKIFGNVDPGWLIMGGAARPAVDLLIQLIISVLGFAFGMIMMDFLDKLEVTGKKRVLPLPKTYKYRPLPKNFKCPYCHVELELDMYERKEKSFYCPKCRRYVKFQP